MEEYIARTADIFDGIMQWIHGMNITQVIGLAIGIAAFCFASKIASRVLKIILKVLTLLSAIYFLEPSLFLRLINWLMSVLGI